MRIRAPVHFWTNAIGKNIEPSSPTNIGKEVSLLFLKDGVGIK